VASYLPTLDNPTFSIVNIHDFKREVVGKIELGRVILTNEVVFPGLVSTPPPDHKV
jgi:hypothetical protein